MQDRERPGQPGCFLFEALRQAQTRAMASTALNEQGRAPDLIELQLAHRDSSVRATYNRSTRLAERRAMMQAWADWLDARHTE